MDPRSVETKEVHKVYWIKLTSLHRDTLELISSFGAEHGEPCLQGSLQICELLERNSIHEAIEQSRFLANYTGEEHFFDRVSNILVNYQDTLPENEMQVVTIIYNLCGPEFLRDISSGKIPESCSKALIFLSGRRKGFILERMEFNLFSMVKKSESEEAQ